jgi:pimeloyl-ACP methyl ester carboxylesterase
VRSTPPFLLLGLLVKVPTMVDRGPTARFETPDGSDIAVYDLGGGGAPLLLAHATGFHAMVLSELARHLGMFHCYGLDFRAHGCSRAAESWGGEWAGFASDVLTVVEGLGLEQPFGFGHSCGGASLLLAEEAVPGTFRHLYCYEPIVMPALEPLPPNFANPLSMGAARRRERFGSKEEAITNYASKWPWSGIGFGVLRDYVDHGFETEPDDTVRLRCRPEDESRVFANAVGHDAFRGLPKVACPVDLACGRLTDAFGEDVLVALDERLRSSGGTSRITVFDELDHFGPMARPDVVAAAMGEAFAAQSAQPAQPAQPAVERSARSESSRR